MPRTRNLDLPRVIAVSAGTLFMRRGYAATRMEMVAEEAGIAPGTLYLYVTGKESLFALALRAAFHEPLPPIDEEPFGLPDRASIIEETWKLVRQRARFPRLERAARVRRVSDAGAEFDGVVMEFYDWLDRYWRGIRMVEKCALEWPELSSYFYRELRRGGLDLLERYLEARARQGQLRRMPDTTVAARVVLETVSFFAMHRHTAPDSENLAVPSTRETVRAVLHHAFVP